MKNFLMIFSFIASFTLLSWSAGADELWECTGTNEIKKITFQLNFNGVSDFKAEAPNLDHIKATLVNEFTLVLNNVLDIAAQETMDFTLLLDRNKSQVSIFSKYAGNDPVTLEDLLECSISQSFY